jgi:pathogen-inducible salicylic acid glucosyltransferase
MENDVKAHADDEGVVRRETIKDCLKEIMEIEKGNEMKKNAMKWKNLARNSVDEGGSSDKNIVDFVNELTLC